MTLWAKANKTQAAPVNKKLWEDLKKCGENLGKHCRVKRIVVSQAFLGKVEEL